ncbi:MAG TPA: DUF4870 domain-containing protein [Candidatus Cybelea sp.]|jgi:hypothetical protein|nr:DUF4870 domain-containing protein [Candidatus Cybelea sp.]
MQSPIAAQDRNWAMAAHLSALVAVAGLPFGHVLGPLIVYLVKGHESEFVGEHARASLNYQITISLLVIVAILVAVAFTLGFAVNSTSESAGTGYAISFAVLWIAIGIGAVLLLLFSLIFIIMGTIAANEGRPYTYPLAIRFLR